MTDRSTHRAVASADAPPTPRWKGRHSLEIVHRFNERCFQLLGQVGLDDSLRSAAAIVENRELWSRLDGAACGRMARFPFLILDVHFQNAQWWRQAIEGSAAAELPIPHSRSLAETLIEETLLFAAQTVNWDASVARLTLGMSQTVIELLRGLPPQLMASIWRRHSAELRLRWQEQPQFWRGLLIAARDGDREALNERHLDAQLRFCTELMDSRG